MLLQVDLPDLFSPVINVTLFRNSNSFKFTIEGIL
jgi:hypothetical protein